MKRISSILAPLVGALILAGCPPLQGEFDLSDLPDGNIDESYSGQLAILDYSGPVSYTLVGGDLPEGLSMNEAGAVTGTPTAAMDPVVLTVLASGMQRVDEFQATVRFSIGATNVDDAFLGYRHDQLTRLANWFSDRDLQRDVWVRAAGGGIAEMNQYQIDLGIYTPGDNGIEERGMDDGLRPGLYDDERIGQVSFSEVEVEYSGWIPEEELTVSPPNYPYQHTPDGDPPTISSDGLVTAGSDSGVADLVITHPDYGEIVTRIMVVPPDWCPKGEHIGGPENPGFCL